MPVGAIHPSHFSPTSHSLFRMKILTTLLLTFLLLANAESSQQQIRIAVASNFHGTLDTLKTAFLEIHPDTQIDLIPGSTGKLYAQIVAGAPYDLFFAADSERPNLLDEASLIQPDQRFTYALGILALWSKSELLNHTNPTSILQTANFEKLAIANPKTAPFGQASIEVLTTINALEKLRPRLIFGENVSQALHYAHTGAVDFAFISFASLPANGSHWLPPLDSYQPIQQQAVLISANETAARFFLFAQSDQAKSLIQSAGYNLP